MSRDYARHTKLAQRMELLGYTVAEVAKGAGVDRWHLNDYLNHGKKISPRHMARVCAFLKCEPESLVEK